MNFIKTYVMHWGNYVAFLFTIISFLEPSIRAFDAANPHSFMAQVFIVLLTLYHSRRPGDKV